MHSKCFHKGKYYISFKRGFEENKKDITISVDKLFDNDSLKLTLSDDDDPMFLCKIQISRCDYEELKKQQGLLIDFDNFPSQVVRLLQQCTTNNMFLILNQINPVIYHFEVVEHNEFKRLVHLLLKTGPASDCDVKQHMAETIAELKKSLSTIKNSASTSEAVWNERCAKMEVKIHEMSITLTKMEEDKLRRETEYQEALKLEKDRLAQEKIQLQKAADINAKNILTGSQQNIALKDKQIEELTVVTRQLKDNIAHIERQMSDKTQRINYLEKEVQKYHLEVTTLSSKNISLDRDITDKDKQIHQLNVKCASLEKTTKDNNDVIKELTENVQTLNMEKTSLERRLSLSESLANRNNEAAQSTSEQLLKANQIISKQNADIIEMKEKLLCRTAIALEQEKVIERNTKDIQDLKTELHSCNEVIDRLKTELDTLKEKNELNEMALKDKDETIKNNNMVIQWLHKKLEDSNHLTEKRTVHNVASSTPYFLNRNNSVLHESDESINYYGTSKSNAEDSNIVQTTGSTTKGLDPKYLKPAAEDNNCKKKDFKPTPGTQKGKENKNVELPKVDYREKKSSKPSTYRATPVSAYFP